RLAGRSGAPVLFAWCERIGSGPDHALWIAPADPGIDDPDPVRATTALNAGVERIARRDPAQYQWTYKRFKARPPGDGPHPYVDLEGGWAGTGRCRAEPARRRRPCPPTGTGGRCRRARAGCSCSATWPRPAGSRSPCWSPSGRAWAAPPWPCLWRWRCWSRCPAGGCGWRCASTPAPAGGWTPTATPCAAAGCGGARPSCRAAGCSTWTCSAGRSSAGSACPRWCCTPPAPATTRSPPPGWTRTMPNGCATSSRAGSRPMTTTTPERRADGEERRLHPWSWLFVLLGSMRQFLFPLLLLLVFGGRREEGLQLAGAGVAVAVLAI